MGAVFFYHLTREPLEHALPRLVEAAGRAGWRVLIKGRARDQLEWLDQKLWLGADDGFLAHGIEGGAHDADQPVLLSLSGKPVNRAECLMAIEGAAFDPAQITAAARTCILFNGNEPAAVQAAREQWKNLTDQGFEAKYWSQETGKWALKAERPAAADA